MPVFNATIKTMLGRIPKSGMKINPAQNEPRMLPTVFTA